MIKIEHLVKNYGSNCAVDDISCEIAAGETVGFLGPNGAGKSTTMNILTGYLSATSGRVSVDGIDMLRDPIGAKKLIGYLPEQPPVYPDMTVDEYLNFNYDLKGCTFDREAHIAEICEVVKISDVRKRLIRNLSKGYRQRVGVAQALIGDPPVIIFDEPTVGLDPKQIIEIRSLIRTLGKNHTVLLSTHILGEVAAVCDRIVIINKGKIVADEKTENITRVVENNRRFNVKVCGPQKDVLETIKSIPGVSFAEAQTQRDGEAYIFTVESDMTSDVRKKLFFTMAERGWAIVGLETVGMSLEDIFISVVDQTEREKTTTHRYERTAKKRVQRSRNALETELAENMVKDAAAKREEDAKSEIDE
ncbi:MAG: ATP-binding cassette domain-containing protein [Ruminococcaceae bacterium]|nr:ATP-binding cassette domain-containing protein [Oscillospiraceae bacterium]